MVGAGADIEQQLCTLSYNAEHIVGYRVQKLECTAGVHSILVLSALVGTKICFPTRTETVREKPFLYKIRFDVGWLSLNLGKMLVISE